jgi:hypothetical protein
MALPVEAIIDRRWARSLRRFADGGKVRYWINGRPRLLDDGTRAEAISRQEANVIRATFTEVDRLTGLRFVEKTRRSTTDIDLFRIADYGEDGLLGQTVKLRGWFEVSWENRGDNRVTKHERSTITHEIAHALGLDHPYGRPFSSRWDTSDTIMSYNQSSNTGFSRTDIAALQELWGTA